jgi:hypothetical protein
VCLGSLGGANPHSVWSKCCRFGQRDRCALREPVGGERPYDRTELDAVAAGARRGDEMRLAVEGSDKWTAINAFRIEPCPAVTEPRAAKSGKSLKQQLRQIFLAGILDPRVVVVRIPPPQCQWIYRSPCRVRMRYARFCLIAITARFLEPFEFDYDDGKRPMTCEVRERIR